MVKAKAKVKGKDGKKKIAAKGAKKLLAGKMAKKSATAVKAGARGGKGGVKVEAAAVKKAKKIQTRVRSTFSFASGMITHRHSYYRSLKVPLGLVSAKFAPPCISAGRRL